MTEFRRPTAADYHAAYSDGATTPRQVADRTLAAIDAAQAGEPSLDAFIDIRRAEVLADAEASTARWEAGAPIGPLDGVPIPIKDEFDIAGYRTGAGTRFRVGTAKRDAIVVERLRAAGAIVFGKTAMTEIGLGGTGINPGVQTPRNPYDPSRFTGGSSSGSAAAVSAGIAPLALGSDAGGSIRMPAALCGVYGIKPTFGRVPASGGALLAWTLDHIGPLGASLEDLIAFMDATAGPDRRERSTKFAPRWRSVPKRDLSELRFAWCPDFGGDAEPDVLRAFKAAIEMLREAGAKVEEVDLRWAEWVQRVGYVTIAAEASASQRDWLREHRREYNLDTRLLLAVAERFSTSEYKHAQRVRSLIRDEFDELLQTYDAFLNPTLACTAQPISDAALRSGEVNTRFNRLVSRYTFAGTLTGFPGITVPLPLSGGLPVGLHFMSGAHSDEALFGVVGAADEVVRGHARPDVYFGDSILPGWRG